MERVAVRKRPDLDIEVGLWRAGNAHVCGIDEAGRGPLAGPVVAAAVILPPDLPLALNLPGLDDSKRLTSDQRGRLEAMIYQVAVSVGVGQSDVTEIDNLNIRRASLLAMKRAVEALSLSPSFLLIDGRDLLELCPIPAMALKGGDGISASIAAASVVAKETRDRIMRTLAEECPGYGWERNMGYPTQGHRKALLAYGVTPHHRRTFKPVAEILG
ncbi:MAG: ribonuclease HII [Nitrospirae bacterium]|nr:ribonuclease HII [Magnetococcales bacterium]HAT48772.1 ribonuclease HII [Alphaproteobacteria bacterium]